MTSKNKDKVEASRNIQPVNESVKKVGCLESEHTTFLTRLQLILGGESARAFAQRAEILPATFHNYIKGTSEPTRPVMVAIAKTAGVNIEWLADGTGPMRKAESLPAPIEPTAFKITNLEGRQVEFKPSPNLCHLPILDLRASCGPGAYIESEAVQAVFSATASWIRRELGANPEDLSLVFADGDSMADTIKPEEIVIVDRSKARRPSDGIWVFLYDEGLFIKRLQFMPGKQIKVKSDNPHYEQYVLSPDDSFRLLGRVIAALPLRRL
ncbi:MAG: S24 family peptidase [Candidatus Riflebacteria bacterium]